MSNLLTRILSSIGFVVLIIGPMLISFRLAFTVFALLGGLTLNEVVRISGVHHLRWHRWFSILIYTILAFMAYGFFFLPATNFYQGLLIVLALLLGVSVSEIFGKLESPLSRLSVVLYAPVLCGISFLLIPYFGVFRTDMPGLWLTISMFVMIWVNDSSAYLIGRKLGKTKLIERVSPGKTREGSLAGLLCSLIAGIGLSFIPGMPSLLFMAGFALVCVVSGSLGDLFESRLKRAAGVKDSGFFLPGHGGFFDRFDAMMFAVPASVIYFEAFMPKS